MHANKFTGQNFEREMAMATTLIENIVNELAELVVQKVMEEFNQRTDEVARRLGEMERALAAQPMVDANFVDERVNALVYRNLEYEVTNIIDLYDMTSKIEDALRDFDLGVEEAVADEISNRTLVTEDYLIEFINDRVRITVE